MYKVLFILFTYSTYAADLATSFNSTKAILNNTKYGCMGCHTKWSSYNEDDFINLIKNNIQERFNPYNKYNEEMLLSITDSNLAIKTFNNIQNVYDSLENPDNFFIIKSEVLERLPLLNLELEDEKSESYKVLDSYNYLLDVINSIAIYEDSNSGSDDTQAIIYN